MLFSCYNMKTILKFDFLHMCVRCACSHVCVCVFVCAFMCVTMGVPVPWIAWLSEGNLGCQPSAFTWIKTRSLCLSLLCCRKADPQTPRYSPVSSLLHLTVEVLDCRCLGEDAAFNRVLSTQTHVLTFVRLGILFHHLRSPLSFFVMCTSGIPVSSWAYSPC